MKKTKALTLLFGAYCGFLIVMNVLATKQIDVWMFTVTTGILVSPLVFIIQDVATEVFGYRTARRMVLTGFAVSFTAVLLYQLSVMIPASQFWQGQPAFEAIFSTVPRIVVASFIAYLIGSLVNAKLMAVMKKWAERHLFFRAITSTVAGQFLDNSMFAFVAFSGILPFPALVSMAVGGTLIEVLYEVIFYPATRIAIRKTEAYVAADNTPAAAAV